ncbi:24233_t:CDS:2, partial [Cetraspora pellucida]
IPLAFSLLNTRAQHQLRPKTGGFWIEVFTFLVDGEGYNSFRQHFHINLATFQAIVARLETHPVFMSNTPNATPVWKQVAIVLWRLANGVGIRMLEQTLGISQGSLQRSCLVTVIRGFENSEAEFENPKLPNVISAMNGSYIPIYPPSENGVRYVNHKNFHFINLLAVVDHEGHFTYIHADEAG